MFVSNQAKNSGITLKNKEEIIDPLTIWLIRIACLLIILVFSGLLLGLPVAILFSKSLLNETVLNAKEVLKNLIESSLV